MKEINVCIRSIDNQLFVSSRDIAVGMGKEHRDVLGKIREILTEREYALSEYFDSTGRRLPEYLLPKNSFILLLLNYQGYNDFKREYIKRFDEMERKLNGNLALNNREMIERLFELTHRLTDAIENIMPAIAQMQRRAIATGESKISIDDVLNIAHRINATDKPYFTLEELARLMSAPIEDVRPVICEMMNMYLIDIYRKRPYRNSKEITRYKLANY